MIHSCFDSSEELAAHSHATHLRRLMCHGDGVCPGVLVAAAPERRDQPVQVGTGVARIVVHNHIRLAFPPGISRRSPKSQHILGVQDDSSGHLGWVGFDLVVPPSCLYSQHFCQILISPGRIGQTVEH